MNPLPFSHHFSEPYIPKMKFPVFVDHWIMDHLCGYEPDMIVGLNLSNLPKPPRPFLALAAGHLSKDDYSSMKIKI